MESMRKSPLSAECRLPLITAATATPEQAALLARTPPINLFALLAHAPSPAGRIAALGASVMGNDIDPAARELVALRIGVRMGGAYVEGQHRRVAARIGLGEELVAAATELGAQLPEGPYGDVLRLADTLAGSQPIEPDLAARLQAAYGSVGLMGLAITGGYFMMLSSVTRTFDLPLEPPRPSEPAGQPPSPGP